MSKSNVNQYGLSRDIPDDKKFQIRKRDGFGCVVCGKGIIDYEHIDPEYKDAQEHNVDGITILCPGCHAKKTRGFLSKESIKSAMKNPTALKNGYCKEIFDVGHGYPIIIFAGSEITKCVIPVMISGTPLFTIKPPEIDNAPFRLSANFFDLHGRNTLNILDNEWLAKTSNWDVIVSCGKIQIREAKRIIHLSLKQVSKMLSKLNKSGVELVTENFWEIRTCFT